MRSFRIALLTTLWLVIDFAIAQAPTPRQDLTTLHKRANQFLSTQTAGLPGAVNINVNQPDTRTNLPACPTPEPFLPSGSRIWGKTTIGIRCTTPSAWTIYLTATVQVTGEYLVTSTPLAQGQQISSTDIAKMKGDLTALPPGIVTDPSQAIGRTAAISLPAGSPLRNDVLRAQHAIQQGQTVRLVSAGPGFRVSTEARALNNAADGQVAQVRTTSGQVISGVAKAGGVVEVTH